ncbi:phosphatidylglycerophosphatase A [Halobacteriovorax sp. GB3]|uniref:phosphatidylglycerophosphatase A family protein n=1 Tax=Halobacteriovorax sp. GB3 TaxID=2719615 RepID=UPI00235E79D4|nr:phosphatidylglycerophosphatase A [Halobacteriovorax sp. GB3]MDD0854574.1 phosphatidylglycerophosphatase A [Halobacteriovorax sp. GB3]
MNDNKRLNALSLENLFLSFFGVGHIPWAPGTFGTLATMPFLYALGAFGTPFFFLIPFIVITFIISCFITDHVQKQLKVEDPSWIVIDEVLGIMVTWLFLQSHHWIHYVVIFIFFRFFDIVKIWPANYVDKNVKNGIGTILDDIISGVYAGLLYLILTKLNIL